MLSFGGVKTCSALKNVGISYEITPLDRKVNLQDNNELAYSNHSSCINYCRYVCKCCCLANKPLNGLIE